MAFEPATLVKISRILYPCHPVKQLLLFCGGSKGSPCSCRPAPGVWLGRGPSTHRRDSQGHSDRPGVRSDGARPGTVASGASRAGLRDASFEATAASKRGALGTKGGERWSDGGRCTKNTRSKHGANENGSTHQFNRCFSNTPV